MSNYFSKFQNSSAYNAAKSSLDLPHVSLISETSDVIFDESLIPNNEIRYKATAKVMPYVESQGYEEFGANIVTDRCTWNSTTKNGVIVFDNNITKFGGTSDEMVSIFGYNSDLISITIPSSADSIGLSALVHCDNLLSVIFSENSIMSRISTNAFDSCSNLTKINLPNSLVYINRYAFAGCRKFTSFTIPNSVTTISDGAFSSCTGLTSITIPNSVTSIHCDAFQGCTGLTTIVCNNVTYNYDAESESITIVLAGGNEVELFIE